jgi:hypothetical protein
MDCKFCGTCPCGRAVDRSPSPQEGGSPFRSASSASTLYWLGWSALVGRCRSPATLLPLCAVFQGGRSIFTAGQPVYSVLEWYTLHSIRAGGVCTTPPQNKNTAGLAGLGGGLVGLGGGSVWFDSVGQWLTSAVHRQKLLTVSVTVCVCCCSRRVGSVSSAAEEVKRRDREKKYFCCSPI